MWSRIKKLVLVVGLLAVAATVLFTLVLSSSPFDGWRRTWIAKHLGDATGLETRIGSASVGIGTEFNIDIRNVRLAQGDRVRLSISGAQFSIPISVMWSDDAAMHAFRLDGVNWDLTDAEKTREPVAKTGEDEAGWSPDALSAFDFRDISIRDSLLRFRTDEGDGSEIAVQTLSTRPGDGENRIVIIGAGTLDGAALELSGGIDDPNATQDAKDLKFDLTWSHPGLSGDFKGALDLSKNRPEVHADLSASTNAPGTLSRLVGLEGEFNGIGQMAGRLDGPITDPAVRDLRVKIRDLEIATAVIGEATDRLSVRLAEFRLSTERSLDGGLRAHDIELEGILAELQGKSPNENDPKETDRQAGGSWSPGILDFIDFKTISLRDGIVRYRDAADSWEHELAVKSFTAQPDETNKRGSFETSGTLNKKPFSIAAAFDDPVEASDRSAIRFELSNEIPGLHSKVEGSLDLASATPGIDAGLSTRSDSLTALLGTLGFAADWDSAGHMTARLKGPLQSPALNAIDMVIEKNQGLVLTVKGGVSNLFEGTGIDLAFKGTLGDETKPLPENAGLLKLEMREFQGKASGNVTDLAFEDLRFVTNILSADLNEIGPIRIGRAIHGEDGKLRLEDIRILDGPEDAPYLDLVGDIGDALEFEDMKFQGKININASDVLVPQSGVNAEAIGRLRGEVVFSRNGGNFAFDAFKARVVDSEVLSLTLALDTGTEPQSSENALKTDLSIPDLTKLAAALGHKLKNSTSFQFLGSISFKEHDPQMAGTITIGKTVAKIDLAGAYSKGAQKVVGSIQSRKLELDDLHHASDAVLLLGKSNLEVSKDHIVIKPSDDLIDRFGLDITVNIESIEGAGKAASHIKGQISYLDDILALDPIKMVFLGGSLSTSIRLDLGKTPVKQRHKGQIRNMPLGRLLKELDIPPTVTGAIFANYDVTSAGDSMRSVARNLSGAATFSLFDSTIDASLINLAGMNTVSWLFSGKSDASKVKCVVAPFTFKNGRGSTGSFVIETDRVQVIGQGSVDVGKNSVNMAFEPRALVKQGVGVTSNFRLTGKLDDPKVELGGGGGAGRAAAEVITAPLNIFGLLLGNGKEDKTKQAGRKPCSPVKQPAAKKDDAKAPEKKKRRKRRIRHHSL